MPTSGTPFQMEMKLTDKGSLDALVASWWFPPLHFLLRRRPTVRLKNGGKWARGGRNGFRSGYFPKIVKIAFYRGR